MLLIRLTITKMLTLPSICQERGKQAVSPTQGRVQHTRLKLLQLRRAFKESSALLTMTLSFHVE